MGKKLKLDSKYNFDIQLIGISFHKLDYSLAWNINRELKINLSRVDDLLIYNQEKGISTPYPLFYCSHSEIGFPVYLISNHHPDGKLFPDYKSIDFFLLIAGNIDQENSIKWISIIKKIPQVLIAYTLDVKKIRNIQEFITDLELHMIEVKAKMKNSR